MDFSDIGAVGSIAVPGIGDVISHLLDVDGDETKDGEGVVRSIESVC